MVGVYILVRVNAGTVWKVGESLEDIEELDSVSILTGPYDIIVHAELPSNQDLRVLLDDMHAITDISQTETCIAIRR
jgi:hypothetical protein